MPSNDADRRAPMKEAELRRNRANVSIAMIDANTTVANSLCTSFRELGYGKVELYRDIAPVELALHGRGIDLIIGDGDHQDGSLLELISRLRNGDLGHNPFTAAIVTSWSRERQTIRRAIDAGVDAILVNPISPGQLVERVQDIVRRRKPFIVTADYTGPERRRDPGRVSTVPAFWPPNSLAEKERGLYIDDADLNRRIDAAAREISEEKLRRSAFQLAFLQSLVDIAVEAEEPSVVAKAGLERLRRQAQKSVSLAKLDGQSDLLSGLGRVIIVVAEMIANVITDTGRVALRREIDLLLAMAFPGQLPAVTREDVSIAIGDYERRRQADLDP